MPTLQGDEIADLVATTLRDLGEFKWTDLATDLQDYVALPKLLKKEKVQFDAGYGIQFNAMVDHSGAAHNTGLYEVDTVNVADVMKSANIPWRHATTNYAYERREVAMNRSPRKIIDLLKIRRADAMISLAELMEDNFWSAPASSSDELAPYGVPYWIVKNNTEGFNGGTPSGFSDVAGLNTTTYPRWRNWTAQYTVVSKDDLVRKMRKAATFTKFKSPTEVPSYSRGNRYGYYANYDVVGRMEELLEAQNDDLGNDVASKDGMVTFRRNPVVWVPKLEEDTTDPIYGINWGDFYPVFLRGEYMKEQGPMLSPKQHTVHEVHIDLTLNFKSCNRRKHFVIALNTA